MSDLTLGPVVGKIGGGAEVLEFAPDSPRSEYTVDLPDGEWAVVAKVSLESSLAQVTCTINGIVCANIAQRSGGSEAFAMKRHVSREAAVRGSRSDLLILSITAYPEPT